MEKKKIVIRVSMPSDKSRAKAMALVSRVSGVSSMTVTGDGLEVVGEGVDAVSLVCCLRGKKKFGHVEILLVEEVKDKKKEEEEKKKKEEEKKKKEEEEKKKKGEKPPHCSCPSGYTCYCHPGPMPYVVCQDQEPATSCSIM